MIPLTLQHQVFASALLTAGSSGIWLINEISLSSTYERIAIFAAYIVINIYGIFTSRRIHLSRRQYFVLLKQEIQERQELSERTAELEETQDRLRLLAITDPLIGVINRRHFMSQTAGDEMQISFAKLCLAELRSTDLFGRYGGDEFIALLVQTGQEGARETAERLRAAIERSEVQVGGKTIKVTMNIGLTTTTGSISSVEELIEIADKALYKAKKGGRNQLIIG